MSKRQYYKIRDVKQNKVLRFKMEERNYGYKKADYKKKKKKKR